MFSMINQFSIVKYAISTPAPENLLEWGAGIFWGGVFPCLAVSSINESKRIPQNKKYRPRSATAGPVHHRQYRTIPA